MKISENVNKLTWKAASKLPSNLLIFAHFAVVCTMVKIEILFLIQCTEKKKLLLHRLLRRKFCINFDSIPQLF